MLRGTDIFFCLVEAITCDGAIPKSSARLSSFYLSYQTKCHFYVQRTLFILGHARVFREEKAKAKVEDHPEMGRCGNPMQWNAK